MTVEVQVKIDLREREVLQAIRQDALELAKVTPNLLWKRRYEELALAADALDLNWSRCTVQETLPILSSQEESPSIEWTGKNWPEVWKFIQCPDMKRYGCGIDNKLEINTRRGMIYVHIGQRIMLNENGELRTNEAPRTQETVPPAA